MVVVPREYLIALLEAWKKDKITANDVMTSTGRVYGNTIPLNWEDNEGLSVTMEVLDVLESLDVNLITKDDIDSYLEFLCTPIGDYKIGAQKLWEYESTINLKQRQEKLQNIEPYSQIYGEKGTFKL